MKISSNMRHLISAPSNRSEIFKMITGHEKYDENIKEHRILYAKIADIIDQNKNENGEKLLRIVEEKLNIKRLLKYI